MAANPDQPFSDQLGKCEGCGQLLEYTSAVVRPDSHGVPELVCYQCAGEAI
jgi:hypothetical protein